MTKGMDLDALAEAAERRRLDLGLSKEEVARRAGISAITYKRIEDGLPVQDAKRRAAEKALGFDEDPPAGHRTRTVVPRQRGEALIEHVRSQLNPDLAEFTEQELHSELEARELLAAARLHAAGFQTLTEVIDDDGTRRYTSRLTSDG